MVQGGAGDEVKKSESEAAIRHLCHAWRDAAGLGQAEPGQLSFRDFHRWILEHHPHVLDFRSVVGPRDDAERWFDEVFGQTWRN